MATPWIITNKLVPPARPAAWLSRPRLLAAGLPPVVLIEAGPGGGKSAALLELVGRTRAAGGPLVWYALDELDADPIAFMQHLLAGVRRHVPGFAAELDAMLAAPEVDPRRVWRLFFAALEAYNIAGLTLVLDDLHHLAEACPDWVRALCACLERPPATMHLLLASRRLAPLPRARLRAAGVLAEVDAAALRFDEAEVEAYLALRAPAGAVPAAWSERAAALDGWPLGLALVTAGHPTAGDTALEGLIAEELVACQPAACQAFMVRAALLDGLAPAALEAAFPGLEAERWSAHLEAQQLVMRAGEGSACRFPAYLGGFLRARAPRTLRAEELAAAHRRAADHHREGGRLDLAIPHLLAVGDRRGASEACRLVFPELGALGRFGPIERWLAAFPAAEVERDGTLLWWRGQACSHRGDADAALEAFVAARARFAAAGDRAGELKALVRLCTLLAHAQDAARLGPLLLEALALLPLGEDVDRADLAMVRGLMADQRGDLALMQACNEAILELPERGPELASAHWIAHLNMYTVAWHRGELDAAATHVAAAIAVAERHGFASGARLAGFMAAHLALVTGETERAAAFVRHLPPRWEDVLERVDQAAAWVIMAQLHEVKEAWRAAEELLARARAVFERAGHKLAVKFWAERSAWLAIARGQPARALLVCEEVAADGTSTHDHALAMARLRARHLVGDVAAAAAGWAPLIAELDERQARLLAVRARLYAAATRAARGEVAGAAADAADALARAEALGYGFLRHQDHALWAELEPFVAPGAPAAVAAPVPAARPEAAPAAPAAGGLEVRCFGGFEVRLDGRPLEHWPRRKAKRVLAALALADRGIDSLGLSAALEEPDGEAGNAAIRLAVMALRRVLEPELGKGEESRFVRSTADGYVLAREHLAFVDVRAFGEAIARGHKLAAGDAVAAGAAYEQALGHYRGNLFEEPFFAGPFDMDRLRLQRDALAATGFLQRTAFARGDMLAAERWARRAIDLVPGDEGGYLALMRLYHAVGDTDRVRQAYWDHRKALKLELDTAPTPEFEAAYRELVGGGAERSPAGRPGRA